MAKRFDPSSLSPADQAAFTDWQQQAQGLLEGGALPAELSYVLNHPEYLQTHPELQQAYDVMKGNTLPQSVKNTVQQQLGKNTNFDWSGGQAGVAKHGGWWSQPESWVQLGLGAAIGGAGAAGAFGGAGGSAASGASGASAAGGSTTAATIGPVTAGLPAGLTGATGAGATTLAAAPAVGAGGAFAPAAGAGGFLGTAGKIIKAAGPIGEVAGQAAAAGAKGRLDEGDLLRKLYESQLLNAQQQHTAGVSDAELQIKQMNEAAKAKRNAQAQALWGGILQGMGDTTIDVPAHLQSHMAKINPGLTPSMIVGKNALGQQVQQSAQDVLDKPPTYQTPTPYAPPPLPTMPSEGAGGKFLDYLGLIGSLGGAAGNYVPGVKKPQNQQ